MPCSPQSKTPPWYAPISPPKAFDGSLFIATLPLKFLSRSDEILTMNSLRFTQLNPFAQLCVKTFPALSPNKNVYLCNNVLKSCIQGENPRWVIVRFRQMLQSSIKPNDLTFSLLIKSFTFQLHSSIVELEAKQIHTHIVKSGIIQFDYIATALLDLYAKSGYIFMAENLFDEMTHRDLISWNSIINGYSHNGYDLDALLLFSEMFKQGVSPCGVTIISVLPSCARLELLFQGKLIHGYGIKIGLELDSRVKNSLISMYGKCLDIDAATVLFEGMLVKDVISWNTMIGAYVQYGYLKDAMLVFRQMCEKNVEISSVTLVNVLSANAPLGCVHSYAVKIGLDADDSVVTSLICTYAKCGNMNFSQLLYELMPLKNLASLTAIVSGYSEDGDIASAVEWFGRIQLEEMKPDAVSMVSVLHGLTNPAYIQVGIAFHGYSIKSGLASDKLVINGLINMYAKFNDIEAASSLFLGLLERPLISWNSIISSYVQAGKFDEAMDLFHQMKAFGHNPDSITMASILSGCSQQGSLHFGRKTHNYILRNNLEIEDFVATALIDMYAKCGSIQSAAGVFKSIKNPCLATWNALISGYGMHGMEHETRSHYLQMLQQGVEPDAITYLGVISACGHSGLVQEGWRYLKIMLEESDVALGVQHYASIVDLLGRAGLIDETVTFVKSIQVESDLVIWLALLGACCIHQEIRLGECLAKHIFLLDYRNGGFYIMMSNLYASARRWDDVARVRQIMRDIGGDGYSGTSLIEAHSSHK